MPYKDKKYYVYILASKPYGVLYIGVTSNLFSRIDKHRKAYYGEGFTNKYFVHLLVHYEVYGEIFLAIRREKNLKKWNRQWKLNLIVRNNPSWRDLYKEVYS